MRNIKDCYFSYCNTKKVIRINTNRINKYKSVFTNAKEFIINLLLIITFLYIIIGILTEYSNNKKINSFSLSKICPTIILLHYLEC